MVPSHLAFESKDNRISITIHKISLESKIKFNALRITLDKKEYELFQDMVDLYWQNTDKTVSPQKKTVVSRKFLSMLYRISEVNKTKLSRK